MQFRLHLKRFGANLPRHTSIGTLLLLCFVLTITYNFLTYFRLFFPLSSAVLSLAFLPFFFLTSPLSPAIFFPPFPVCFYSNLFSSLSLPSSPTRLFQSFFYSHRKFFSTGYNVEIKYNIII